jgi:hypothetical protein
MRGAYIRLRGVYVHPPASGVPCHSQPSQRGPRRLTCWPGGAAWGTGPPSLRPQTVFLTRGVPGGWRDLWNDPDDHADLIAQVTAAAASISARRMRFASTISVAIGCLDCIHGTREALAADIVGASASLVVPGPFSAEASEIHEPTTALWRRRQRPTRPRRWCRLAGWQR